MKKRIIAFAVMCMLLLGLCGSVMAYAADIIIEDYTYILGDTGTGWGGNYTDPINKKRGANSRAVNNMEYSSGNGSTVLFRVQSRNGLRWFVAPLMRSGIIASANFLLGIPISVILVMTIRWKRDAILKKEGKQ